jgi:hypothetical protein
VLNSLWVLAVSTDDRVASLNFNGISFLGEKQKKVLSMNCERMFKSQACQLKSRKLSKIRMNMLGNRLYMIVKVLMD